MKKYLLLILTCTIFFCTGCQAGEQPELTEEENNMIAEYIAGMLLKHDMRYEHKLLYDTAQEETAEVSPSASLDTTTEMPKESMKPTEPEKTAVPEIVYQTIGDIYEDYRCKVTYSKAKTYKSYSESPEDDYVVVDVNSQNRVLIVSFHLENTKAGRNNIFLFGSGITYRLTDEKGNSMKPLLTALTNDLQYLDVTLEKNKGMDAVIAFSVPEKAKVSDYSLIIANGDKKAKVDLK